VPTKRDVRFHLAQAFALLAALIAASVALAATDPAGDVAAQLQYYVDHHLLAGAVTVVASKERALDVETVGFADVAARKPMAVNTLFWIASMTKPITATALMMLVDEGKVSVNDPVEKYLPEFKGRMVSVERDDDHMLLRRAKGVITIKNLLTHTSGLPYMARTESRLDMLPLRENVDFVYPLLALQAEPSSTYSYSNVGVEIVARVIEVVSGMSYEDFLQQRLLTPLGMKDTTFWPNAEQLGRLAKSYKVNAAWTGLEETPCFLLTYPLDDRRRAPSPSGGLFSTATDISIFSRMILNNGVYAGRRYLSESAVSEMTSTQTGDLPVAGNEAWGYGYCWNTVRQFHKEIDPVRTMGSFGHGGAYCTMMWIDRPRQRATVFMIQCADIAERENAAMWTAFMKAAEAGFGN
jgi:CubicO group peptidase (beta-lactamase class C family)